LAKICAMNSWHTASASPPAVTLPVRPRQRRHYRHQIQSLAYLNLDESNGGIIHNVGDSGIAVQSVAPLRADQQVFLRFDLINPRVRVEGTGRVAWADPVGQAGIEFLTLSHRSRRGLKDWIFIQLLTTAQAVTDSNFIHNDNVNELLFSSTSRPAIRVDGTVPRTGHPIQSSPALRLSWLPFAVSAQTLTRLVDSLILLSAMLLFAVICMAMVGTVPSWPIALLLGCGVCGVFVVLYHFLFLFWIGGTPGFYVARLASDALNGASRETDDRPRFR
jgi:hypothetical protein